MSFFPSNILFNCTGQGCNAVFDEESQLIVHIIQAHNHNLAPNSATMASLNPTTTGQQYDTSNETPMRPPQRSSLSQSPRIGGIGISPLASPPLSNQPPRFAQTQISPTSDFHPTHYSLNAHSASPNTYQASRGQADIRGQSSGPQNYAQHPERSATPLNNSTKHQTTTIPHNVRNTSAANSSSNNARVMSTTRQSTADNIQHSRPAWPSAAEDFLRNLIFKRRFFSFPTTQNDQKTFAMMFEEFKGANGFAFLKCRPDDPKIPKLFLAKIRELQIPIVAAMEKNAQRERGSRLTAIHDVIPNQETSQSGSQTFTPPQTPVIAASVIGEGVLKFWKLSEASVQVDLFRTMLRTAKDPQRLKVEWDLYCREQNGKELSLDETIPKAHHDSQAVTPVFTPLRDPGPDLETMIEARLQQRRLKRQRDQEIDDQEKNVEANRQEQGLKRLKSGLITLD